MVRPLNVLIMMHGMVPDEHPSSPYPVYDHFWNNLLTQRPELPSLISKRIGVQWGHELPGSGCPLRDDEKLTRAQQYLFEQVNYRAVKEDKDPNNRVMFDWCGIPVLRGLIVRYRENLVIRGFGDVVYYCSSEGETQLRRVVYDQVLRELDEYRDETDVRFHLFGHSLGVTVCHDFLYGLFNPDKNYRPGFVSQGSPDAVERFLYWRGRAQTGNLKLGSLATAASQLPLFVMRVQKLVNRLADGLPLDVKDIGIVRTDRIQWKIFYDVDDILGFATRRIYAPNQAIMDIQVNCSWEPLKAHTGYWESERVISETAELIVQNAG